jgi:hypothetical protein
MPDHIDAADDWLDSWAAGVSAQAERAATLSRRVAALTGSAESADGSIKVTVGSSGRVESLELADRTLGRRVLSVMRRAQASLVVLFHRGSGHPAEVLAHFREATTFRPEDISPA